MLGFWWHINPYIAYKKRCCRATAWPGVTFTSVTVSLHMFAHVPTEMDAWSYGKRMRSICMATFPDLYVIRWMSCFLERFPRNRLIARAFSRVI